MKKIFFFLSVFFCLTIAYGQPLPDSVTVKYKLAKTDKEKGNCLMGYFKHQTLNDAKANILVLKNWFEKQNDDAGKSYANIFAFASFNVWCLK